MVGKIVPRASASAQATHSNAPAAPSMWPVIDLVELTMAARAFSSPSAFLMASVSEESLSGVPVHGR